MVDDDNFDVEASGNIDSFSKTYDRCFLVRYCYRDNVFLLTQGIEGPLPTFWLSTVLA